MKHTVKEFYNTKPKVVFWIATGLISMLIYCFTGQQLDESALVEKECEISGKC